MRTVRALRLWSGLIMSVFVVMHLSNHAIGLLSLDEMEAWRWLNAGIWQHPVGSITLYGALLVHFVLGLMALYRRRTLRMPLWEFTQLAFGLAIPLLLVGHIIGTRLTQELLAFDVRYPYVVTALWNDYWLRAKQILLVTVVWAHLAVGLHFWLRLKPWYPRVLPYLFAFAVLLPVLALLGFARAGLETAYFADDPFSLSAIRSGWNEASAAQRALIARIAGAAPWLVAGIMLVVLAAGQARLWLKRRARRTFRIEHSDGHVVTGRVGQTLLEALRAARIPHASVCGGRARCTTCRVRVGAGLGDLAPPPEMEAAALRRIGAPPNVRLACQLRPRADLAITPLIPPSAGAREVYRPGGVSGGEREVAILFVDLRGSTRLGETRLPYDVVYILNQFFAEMSAALDATGGHYAQFAGDGLMALYGLDSDKRAGCRAALSGAGDMARRLRGLNQRLAPELDEPLRIGMGIHSGEAIVGTMGPPHSPNLSAIGDNVNVAARLEALTKVYGCTLVVSRATAECAGIDLSRAPVQAAEVRGRSQPVDVFAVADPVLDSLIT